MNGFVARPAATNAVSMHHSAHLPVVRCSPQCQDLLDTILTSVQAPLHPKSTLSLIRKPALPTLQLVRQCRGRVTEGEFHSRLLLYRGVRLAASASPSRSLDTGVAGFAPVSRRRG